MSDIRELCQSVGAHIQVSKCYNCEQIQRFIDLQVSELQKKLDAKTLEARLLNTAIDKSNEALIDAIKTTEELTATKRLNDALQKVAKAARVLQTGSSEGNGWREKSEALDAALTALDGAEGPKPARCELCGQHHIGETMACPTTKAKGACPKCWGPIEADRTLCRQCHDAEAIGTPGEKAGNPWAPNQDYPGKPIADKPASDEVRKERARCAAILDKEGRRAMDSGATELAGVFWSLEAKIKQGDPVDGPEKTRERA